VNTIIPKASASLLQELSLENCRITQDEESHMKKWNGSMFAYDIWCWWKFKVYTPTYFDVYVIEKIWYDERLWDYIILKHWDYRFVYWHTYTDLSIWDRLDTKTILWETNKSWISTWHHLHIELWKWFDNIKFEHLYWLEKTDNPKSFDLRNQRKWIDDKEINTKILDFIKDFEWCNLTAYYDYWQYSIWYWTKSYIWETITQEEAELRARQVIQSIKERYWLYNYDINIQIALISFIYNIWSLTEKQLWLLRNWYYKALANNMKEYNKITIDWKKVIAWWLVKRRQAEFNLLNF